MYFKLTFLIFILFSVLKTFSKHFPNNFIYSLAVHPDQSIVASGQVAGLELDGRVSLE